MGQTQILRFLAKNKSTEFSAIEISKRLRLSIGAINVSLKKLFDQGLIRQRTVRDTRGISYIWSY